MNMSGHLHIFMLFLSHVASVQSSGSARIEEYGFGKLHLCSYMFPSTTSLPARSRLSCVSFCAAQNTCTACSYVADNLTCNLHHEHNLQEPPPKTCNASKTAAHFLKLTKGPQIQCQNGGAPVNNGLSCQCHAGFVGNHCQRLMTDCAEGLTSGHYPAMTGFYYAWPLSSPSHFQVRCDTQVQHIVLTRWAGDIDFDVDIAHFVRGFGTSIIGDYWMGLEALHQLTNSSYVYTLGMQVSNVSAKPYYQHRYTGFKVKDKSEGYAMTFTSHHVGPVPAEPMGDCLTPLMDIPFSSKDVDNDGNPNRNCAVEYGGGWWYNSNCSQCNLVGRLRIMEITRETESVNEVFWLPGLQPDFSPDGAIVFLFR